MAICPEHSGICIEVSTLRREVDDHERRLRPLEVFRVRGALLVTLVGTILSGVLAAAITYVVSTAQLRELRPPAHRIETTTATTSVAKEASP